MAYHSGHAWTIERREALLGLIELKLSAAEIAGRLGGGLTRNAVIGAIRRRGLKLKSAQVGKHTPGQKKNEPKVDTHSRGYAVVVRKARVARAASRRSEPVAPPVFARKPEPVRPARSDIPEPAGPGLLLVDASDAVCKWPVGGSARDLLVCGHPVWFDQAREKNSPYCEHHHDRAHDRARNAAARRSLQRGRM